MTLIADWTFQDSGSTFTDSIGGNVLSVGSGSPPSKIAGGPFGQFLRFTGSEYLIIPGATVGATNLNRGAGNSKVTVVAWLKSSSSASTDLQFVAGMWREFTADPKRQYGMFLNLPRYGGDVQVCGHVSKTGGPTPGYSYSRDYSAAKQRYIVNEWLCAAFTYDTAQAVSYTNAYYESRPSYTDSNGNTYAKNPYLFADGLNATYCDFTVGACELTGGFANFFKGDIARIQIYDTNLTADEIYDLHRTNAPAIGRGIVQHTLTDFTTTGTASPGAVGHVCSSAAGAINRTSNTTAGTAIIRASNSSIWFLATTATTANHFVYDDTAHAIDQAHAASISFDMNGGELGRTARIMARVGGQWYASAETYQMGTAAPSAGDWSTAETKTKIWTRDKAAWLQVTFTLGSTFSIGATPATDLATTPIEKIGFVLLNGNNRVRRLRVDAVTSSTVSGNGVLAGSVPVVAGTGVVTSSGDGALAGSVAVVAGVGAVTSAGNGALAGSVAVVAGTGAVTSTGVGVIVGPVPVVNGLSSGQSVGALVGSVPVVVGVGAVISAGSGALVGPIAVITGTGAVISAGSGTLVGPVPVVAGASAGQSVGALVGPVAVVAGAGSVQIAGTGIIIAPVAVVSGRDQAQSKRRVAFENQSRNRLGDVNV